MPAPRALARVVEHLLDALRDGGHDGVVQHSVQTGQHQGAQDNGDQHLDGGIDITLAGIAADGAAVESDDGRLAVVLAVLARFLNSFFIK